MITVRNKTVLKYILIAVVIVFQSIAKEREIMYANLVALLAAFFVSFHLHEKFFPLFTVSIALFIMASVQGLYNIQYTNLPVTVALHLAARMMFAVAIVVEIFKTKENGKS